MSGKDNTVNQMCGKDNTVNQMSKDNTVNQMSGKDNIVNQMSSKAIQSTTCLLIGCGWTDLQIEHHGIRVVRKNIQALQNRTLLQVYVRTIDEVLPKTAVIVHANTSKH